MPHRNNDNNREKATAVVVTLWQTGIRIDKLRDLDAGDVNERGNRDATR